MSVHRTMTGQMAFEYQEAVYATDETILLLHGNGFQAALWGQMADLLNVKFNLLKVDLRGEGNGQLTWKTICDDIHAMLESLGVPSVHLVGHSFGASLAVSFAHRYPDRAKSLVLLSSVIYYPLQEGSEVIQSYVNAARKHGLTRIIQQEILPHLTLLNQADERVRLIMKSYSETSENLYFRLLELQMLERPVEAAQNVQCPTLLLAGEKDRLYLPELQSITAGYFKHGTFLIVPNAANASFIDQPVVTAAWIMDFIEKTMENRVVQSKTISISSHLPHTLHSSVHADAGRTADRLPVINVKLVDSFQVRIDGIEVKDGWEKRFAKNILAYLIFNPSCTREELCDALFPESNLVVAHNNLRVYLNYLKKLLTLPDGTPLLEVNRKSIRIAACVECDLLTCIKQLKALLFAADEINWTDAKELLGRLTKLDFLTGIYDQWFIDLKFYFEDQLSNLSLMVAEREERRNHLESASYFRRLSKLFAT